MNATNLRILTFQEGEYVRNKLDGIIYKLKEVIYEKKKTNNIIKDKNSIDYNSIDYRRQYTDLCSAKFIVDRAVLRTIENLEAESNIRRYSPGEVDHLHDAWIYVNGVLLALQSDEEKYWEEEIKDMYTIAEILQRMGRRLLAFWRNK